MVEKEMQLKNGNARESLQATKSAAANATTSGVTSATEGASANQQIAYEVGSTTASSKVSGAKSEQSKKQAYYLDSPQAWLKTLASDAEKGLSVAQVAEKLKTYGYNKLKEAEKEPFWRKVLRQFEDFTVLILIVASIISGFTGDWLEAAIIIAIVIVNAFLGVLQEGRAEKAVEALKKMSSTEARVLRDGQQLKINAEELVPGDVILLEAGDVVPADVRLLSSSNLKVEEAALTGESVPVDKASDFITNSELQLGDRKNMLFSTTAVTYGKAKALVVSTGEATEIGFIADRLSDIDEQMTPLQVGINQLGKVLGIACIIITIITFLFGLLEGGEPLKLFITAVSLAVAAIPEGLPAVVTIVLAIGMNRMATQNAIVKRLLAVETLGSVNVICSDKTGTLTQNAMTVTKLYAAGINYEVSGSGYAPVGEIKLASKVLETANQKETFEGQKAALNQAAPSNNSASSETQATTAIDLSTAPVLKRLLQIATLCNDAELIEEKDQYKILGDPTEGALLTVAAKAKLQKQALQAQYNLVGDLPFDSSRKMMTVFYEGLEAETLSLTKGAPDLILDRCDFELTEAGIVPLEAKRKAEILKQNSQYAAQALRVLAFAYKQTATLEFSAETGMIFVGLAGMIDPARPEAKAAIAICQQAGIDVKMITGDYKETAQAIANDLGLLQQHQGVLTGAEIERLSDQDLQNVVNDTTVYARVSPEHKVRIVEALENNGAIAAMTGDGVNDAPALKRADIGVAMGITGTEVAKGAASMILTDDNFATIVSAVEEGRVIYSNIRKFVGFLLSCNIGEILVIFLSIMILGPEMIPLEPIQLLWLNLVTDSFPALALGREMGERDIMFAPPRKRDTKILDKEMALSITVQALAIFACVFAAFTYGRYMYPDYIHVDGVKVFADTFNWLGFPGHSPSEGARTMAFTTLICAELLRAYSCRSEHYSVFSIGFFSNKVMVRSTLLSLALLLVVIYVPFLEPVFSTIDLTWLDWLVVIGLSLVPFIAGEIFKLVYHRKTRKQLKNR